MTLALFQFIQRFEKEFRSALPAHAADVKPLNAIYPVAANESLHTLYKSVFTYLDQESPAPKAMAMMTPNQTLMSEPLAMGWIGTRVISVI